LGSTFQRYESSSFSNPGEKGYYTVLRLSTSPGMTRIPTLCSAWGAVPMRVMLLLGLTKYPGLIKTVVEQRVQMMSLMGEDGAERAVVRGKASITPVHIVAIRRWSPQLHGRNTVE